MIKILFKEKILLLCSTVVLALVNVVSTLLAPQIIGFIIDELAMFEVPTLLFLSLIIVYAISNISMWLVLRLTNIISFDINKRLREFTINKLSKLSISYYDTTPHGEIVNTFINDIDQVSEGLLNSLYVLIQGSFSIVLSTGFMIWINIPLTLVVMVSAPMSILVARYIVRMSQNIFDVQAKNLALLNGFAEETISGYKVIQGYQNEEKSIAEFVELNKRLYDSGFKSQFISSLSNPSTRVVNNIVYICVGVIGSIIAMSGDITVGTISTFLIYSTMFGKPFNDITNVIPQIQSAKSSFQRIQAFLNEEEELDNREKLPKDFLVKGNVVFDNVSFGYSSDMIINDFNLSVPQGTKVAIVGKTGAGKTTLTNLILRFYDVNKGSIVLDGYDISTLNRDELRSQFGLVLQDTWLFGGTILENIVYGNDQITIEEVKKVCEMLDIDNFINQLENGYNTIIRSSNSGISEGQKQLLSIARVIVSNPKVVILDEATSNIDTYSEIKIQESFDRLTEGKTSFIIAHRLSTIKNADLIIVMDKGDVVEYGNHDTLLGKQGYYSRLYQSQFEN